jgi:hypothetical protein
MITGRTGTTGPSNPSRSRCLCRTQRALALRRRYSTRSSRKTIRERHARAAPAHSSAQVALPFKTRRSLDADIRVRRFRSSKRNVTMVVDAMGERATLIYPKSMLLHMGHVHIHEVLHGVLYPEAHDNGLQKKTCLLRSRLRGTN